MKLSTLKIVRTIFFLAIFMFNCHLQIIILMKSCELCKAEHFFFNEKRIALKFKRQPNFSILKSIYMGHIYAVVKFQPDLMLQL